MDDETLREMLSEMSHVWKTESAFMSWIRGGIRRSLWNRHPVKLEFIKNNRMRIPNPNPRGKVAEVWGGVCALTGETHVIANLEVDHKTGNHSLRCIDDVNSFVAGIVLITESDLQFVSKEAHKIKSYSEKYNITFNQAKVEKTIIQLRKEKKVVDRLLSLGVGSIPKLKKDQESLLRQLLLEGLVDE